MSDSATPTQARLLGELAAAKEFFDRSTASLSEDDSAFTPTDGVYTAAQQVAHVAHTVDWFLEGAFRPEGFDMDFEDHNRKIAAVTSLAEARAWLDRAVASAQQTITTKSDEEWMAPLPDGPVMGGQPRAAIFGGITDHTAHHRGALTVYARLRGKTPPMPYM